MQLSKEENEILGVLFYKLFDQWSDWGFPDDWEQIATDLRTKLGVKD